MNLQGHASWYLKNHPHYAPQAARRSAAEAERTRRAEADRERKRAAAAAKRARAQEKKRGAHRHSLEPVLLNQ